MTIQKLYTQKLPFLFTSFVAVLSFMPIAHSYADSTAASINVMLTAQNTCAASASSPVYNVPKGNTVDITITNLSMSTALSISGPGVSGRLGVDNKTAKDSIQTFSLGSITSLTQLTITPIANDAVDSSIVNNCPTSATPMATYFTINPVAAAVASPITTPSKNPTITDSTPITTTPEPVAEPVNQEPVTTKYSPQSNSPITAKNVGLSNSTQASISFGLAAFILVLAFLYYKSVINFKFINHFLRRT